MSASEVILEVGAEGGAITLYGVRDPDGWRYSTSVLDQAPALLPGEFDKPGILRWLIPGKPRFDSSIAIPGTDSTHSQFIRSFVNGFGLPCRTGSAAIEDRRWIGRLNVGAIDARRACCDVG
jgi:hypothetical protein